MHRLLAVALSAALLSPVPSFAQATGHDHGAMTSSKPAPAAGKSAPADGEVRRVDAAKGTIVLKHGPLEAIGMGPMTMEFKATDPKILANVKPGDKVKFVPLQGRNGEMLVGSIEVVK
jgi:Cu(I)/Ag(I) efflux system periplasmic protein CusF